MATAKTMDEKLRDAAPYNIFYNTMPTHPSSKNTNFISFSDFLCPSLGALKCSLQFFSKVDIEWLTEQYEKMNVGKKPLTVVCSDVVADQGDVVENATDFESLDHVTFHRFPSSSDSRDSYNHHEKFSIYVYNDDSLRVVISTGNLYKSQWEYYNHGFWVSPLCRRVSDETSGESPTNFKRDLVTFLSKYNLPVLQTYIEYVKMADFSDVKVFLMASHPGYYDDDNPDLPLNRMERLIKDHCFLSSHDEPTWPLVAQASNIGKLGVSPNDWLCSFFLGKLVPHERAKLKIVFPTWKQVMNGDFPSDLVGTGLRYTRSVHNRQKWLNEYLHCWEADGLGRTGIIPHTKTYCRLSPCWKKMAWFLFTSANINRSAWGSVYNSRDAEKNGKIFVRNYETGVMFFPKFFDEEHFSVLNKREKKFQGRLFPLVYDVPLKRYSERDHPWSVRQTRN